MELPIKLLWFFVHLALSAIFSDMIGSLMSEQQNIFITLIEGIILILILISIFLHAKHLILHIKNQTK